MLTDKGHKALTEFIAETHAVIVNRLFSDSDYEILDIMLKDWQSEPTEEKEQKIISRFAIDRGMSTVNPGDDY